MARDVGAFLRQAEELEKDASRERVTYLETLGVGGPVLDVGCGNGYAVGEWLGRGVAAVGVDSSFHRLTRWIGEGSNRSLVVADATALPFRTGQFTSAYSSGLIEHVGVAEEGGEAYRVTELPDKHERRREAVAEMCRVTVAGGCVILDFPNGMFPIDFWHGTTLGSLRWHPIPDGLNPTVWDIARYVPDAQVTILPVGNRLRFRQISRRWWGRALHRPVEGFLRALDRLPDAFRAIRGVLYPFLVVRIRPRAAPQNDRVNPPSLRRL